MKETKETWWGYQHENGSLQVKRFFNYNEILEASRSGFVARLSGKFEAEGREEAIVKLKEIFKL